MAISLLIVQSNLPSTALFITVLLLSFRVLHGTSCLKSPITNTTFVQLLVLSSQTFSRRIIITPILTSSFYPAAASGSSAGFNDKPSSPPPWGPWRRCLQGDETTPQPNRSVGQPGSLLPQGPPRAVWLQLGEHRPLEASSLGDRCWWSQVVASVGDPSEGP